MILAAVGFGMNYLCFVSRLRLLFIYVHVSTEAWLLNSFHGVVPYIDGIIL